MTDGPVYERHDPLPAPPDREAAYAAAVAAGTDEVTVTVTVTIPAYLVEVGRFVWADPDTDAESLVMSWIDNGMENLHDWGRDEGVVP